MPTLHRISCKHFFNITLYTKLPYYTLTVHNSHKLYYVISSLYFAQTSLHFTQTVWIGEIWHFCFFFLQSDIESLYFVCLVIKDEKVACALCGGAHCTLVHSTLLRTYLPLVFTAHVSSLMQEHYTYLRVRAHYMKQEAGWPFCFSVHTGRVFLNLVREYLTWHLLPETQSASNFPPRLELYASLSLIFVIKRHTETDMIIHF